MLTAFLLATVTAVQDPFVAPESIQKYCSDVIGVNYQADDFTDEEWWQYVGCVRGHLQHQV